jgi:hypothetical protein
VRLVKFVASHLSVERRDAKMGHPPLFSLRSFANRGRMWVNRIVPTCANRGGVWVNISRCKAEAGTQLSEGCDLLELLVSDGDAQALLQLDLQLHPGEAVEMQVAVEAGLVAELCRWGASDGCDENGERVWGSGGRRLSGALQMD